MCWQLRQPCVNGGVIWYGGTYGSQQLADAWHCNWEKNFEVTARQRDQPALNYALCMHKDVTFKLLSHAYNAQYVCNPDVAHKATIWHAHYSSEVPGRSNEVLVRAVSNLLSSQGAISPVVLASSFLQNKSPYGGRIPSAKCWSFRKRVYAAHDMLKKPSDLMISGDCNVLAIGHDASLTGAPLLLLSYLKEAIEHNPALSARAFLLRGGELAAEYAHLCDTYIPQAPHGATLWQRFIFKIKRKMRVDSADEPLKRWLGKSPSPDVIYVNTVASISALKKVLNCLSRAPKTVIHVHELDWLLMKYQSMDNIKEQLDNAYRVIAPSVSVAHALEHRLSIPASKIELIHEWVCRPINVEDYTAHYRSLVRAELGLGPSDILCLSVGRAQWRKGSDLMPLIAKRCSQANPSIRFAWVGDCSEDERFQQDLECKKLGLTDTLYWIKEQADPYPYLAAADLYLLPSREDPYPVAMLEAALFGLPIICFEQGGGAPEFIQSGGGVAVPYLDIDRFSAEILVFASQPGLRAVMGDAAKICALQSHTIKHAEPLISKVLADAVQQ